MTDTPKYPATRIRLNGTNPPDFYLVALLGAALQRSGADPAEIDTILSDVIDNGSSDIIAACRKYVHVQ